MGELGAVIAGLVGAFLFVEVFLRLGALSRTALLLGVYRRAWRTVRSPRISDHWKERVLPRYAAAMLAGAALLALILAAAILMPVAAAFAAAFAVGGPQTGMDLLAGWPFNLAALAGGVLYALARRLALR